MKLHIDKTNRQQEVTVSEKIKKLKFDASRKDCRDVLVEFVDNNGSAKSKPLNKCFEEMKVKDISKIRFIMNEMSVKPIEISILF
jgi:hypothetical protein